MSDEPKMDLGELLRSAGRQLRTDFQELQNCNPHASERGGEAEDILKRFLRDRLPKRFGVESGLVIGEDGSISRQSDVIVFDALNSAIYRNGPRVHILPRDNVAAVVEVKSKLNKQELADAAQKIASVKKIKASPISGIDQPVTFASMIMTGTLGCVFAFDSYTSLEALANNLQEINEEHEPRCWIDLVVVLDKGCIGYAFQRILDNEFAAWDGGSLEDEFLVPPMYRHLVCGAFGEDTLNHFFLKLMAHLIFFRKVTHLSLNTFLPKRNVVPVQSYQYNLKRNLVKVPHKVGQYQIPKIRFNLYLKNDRRFVGQVSLLDWQDGKVIVCSCLLPPTMILGPYFRELGLRFHVVEGSGSANVVTTYVLQITDEHFVRISEQLHADLITVRDGQDDKPPPTAI